MYFLNISFILTHNINLYILTKWRRYSSLNKNPNLRPLLYWFTSLLLIIKLSQWCLTLCAKKVLIIIYHLYLDLIIEILALPRKRMLSWLTVCHGLAFFLRSQKPSKKFNFNQQYTIKIGAHFKLAGTCVSKLSMAELCPFFWLFIPHCEKSMCCLSVAFV